MSPSHLVANSQSPPPPVWQSVPAGLQVPELHCSCDATPPLHTVATPSRQLGVHVFSGAQSVPAILQALLGQFCVVATPPVQVVSWPNLQPVTQPPDGASQSVPSLLHAPLGQFCVDATLPLQVVSTPLLHPSLHDTGLSHAVPVVLHPYEHWLSVPLQ